MDCLDENTIVRLFDGQLPNGTARGVQDHLDTCVDCRALVAELARSGTSVPSAPISSTEQPSSPYVGAIIGNRYRLERVLGSGGMGIVWAGHDEQTKASVALKFLRKHAADYAWRVLREAKIAMALRHPNIVSVHDVLETETRGPVIVMDLLEGETLEAGLQRQQTMTLEELAPVAIAVSDALAFAHASAIVHRDLKPHNIFIVDKSATRENIRLLDFGMAKDLGETGSVSAVRLTKSGAVIGTPHYMAPEQIFAEKQIDARADIWALGVILFRALTGKFPVHGKSFGQIFKTLTTGEVDKLSNHRTDLAHQLVAAIDHMLIRDRDQRSRSFDELRASLSLVR